ncbi:MurR/RpiR family transcriptional regulator [Zophobihabitans entericus]|uniref:MurR/RpiR family transcriptional regulator n=1 Tax=Zophobihabitans entericus TaxID=1635327 RepID=A0A6G9IBG7_9GAMM|nr:MurR/RpiR family transcriptional regulator [Zophobihabitans entericus]QIQ21576.1 MurR/RpiR family transcriptional regulator [Zophobihabitans entericus]
MSKNEQLSALHNEIRSRYDGLSKRLQQVARYVLDNGDSVCFDTITVIAQKAEVPPSTLIRFARLFGFKGFNDMKRVLRQYHIGTTPLYTERVNLSETESGQFDDLAGPQEVLSAFAQVNIEALQELPAQVHESELKNAIRLLKNADNIYVVGFRRSFSVACYLSYALCNLEMKSILIDSVGGMYRSQLNGATKRDVIFVVSYSPYATEVLELLEIADKRGMKKIALTDSHVSPLLDSSNVTFVVKEAELNHFRSQVVSLSLIQSLVVSLALQKAKKK